MDNFETASSARLIQTRFANISASREKISGKGGAIDIEVTINVAPSSKSPNRATAKLLFSVKGFPNDGQEKKNPEFTIAIEARGLYEWQHEIDQSAFSDHDLISILGQPLYLKTLAMVDALSAGIGFPGLKFDQDFRLAPRQSEAPRRTTPKRKAKPQSE